jgi:glycosyltransferase involved in cell wall biosynthesis
LKVAFVHDWLTGMRGGERVLERLCGLFPDADLFTLLWKPGAVSPLIERRRIVTSWLQRLPGVTRRYRWYLPLFPAAVESLDLTGYDAVVSMSHAVAKSARTGPKTFHISYVFTPMRYIWDFESEYFPASRFRWPLSWYVRRTCARLRAWDAATSRRPDAMMAISHHVAERIRRHYGRDVEVLYPPVELERFRPDRGPRDYLLLAGARAPYKRGELAIEACARLRRRLVVAGVGPMEAALRKIAGPDVEFRTGWLSDEDMARLYAGARAVLYPGEEDFGIVPLEALASGCPVIAYGTGGVLETVGRGATADALTRVKAGGVARVPGGVLFGRQTADSLAEAIAELDRAPFDPVALAELARPFGAERFDNEFRAAFDRHFLEWKANSMSGAARS